LIFRTHQHVRLHVGPRGRIEGDGGDALARTLREAGVTLSPLSVRPRASGHQAVADLGCYFGVHAGGRDLDPALADRLREHAVVEFAYAKPPVALPAAPGAADDLRAGQAYLGPAPDGIGARAAWARPGGRGAGVRLIDVEGDWRFTHQDLGRRFALVGGRPEGDVTRRNHGTNVLGMLLGVHDERGVDGICPAAAVRAVSYQPEDRWGSARAITYAAGELRPGDVLLLEMSRPGPRAVVDPDSQDGYLPMSYWPDDLTAIQYAVARGVIVVEAAANGAEHLDDPVYAGPGPGFRPHRPNPFARDGLDSGSILVGAGAPPGGKRGPDRSRLRFSNWGSAIDAQGWGRDVATTGGLGPGADTARPGGDEDAWYTGGFSGTSSAAPMVAGALACVQGVLRAEGRMPLDPAQARAALRETGSPQQPAADGSLQRIGNRPDIGQLIEWALEATRPARPTTPRPRRTSMKVTITIEDDGDGPRVLWSDTEGPYIKGPYIKGPYIKGPSLVIPREDGTETLIDIAGLEAAAGESEKT
jgi:Subtilase family